MTLEGGDSCFTARLFAEQDVHERCDVGNVDGAVAVDVGSVHRFRHVAEGGLSLRALHHCEQQHQHCQNGFLII